jgi:hypothetical protein
MRRRHREASKSAVEYEHIIEVNDATVPEPLSRAQLWQGLLLRAERPDLFVGGLENFRILARYAEQLERELVIGDRVVRDLVTVTPQTVLRFDVRDGDGFSGDSFAMTIEEPEPEELFVRFAYSVQLGEQINEDSPEADALTGAYYRVDRDTILLAQRYVRTGRID